MRLETFLAAHALRHPAKAAVTIGSAAMNYASLLASSRSLAQGLRRAGVKDGDRVVIYLPNCFEFIQLLFAAFAAGAVAVPVHTRNTPRELAYFAKDSRARIVVYHADSAGAIEEVADDLIGVRRIVVGSRATGADSFEALAEVPDAGEVDLASSCNDAMILYTSGTTGQPKGAVLTHANFIVGQAYLNAVQWELASSDIFLVTTPLAHRTGLARVVNAMCLGAELVVMERFDAQNAIATIERHGVTAIGMVPTVARMLMPVLETDSARCHTLRHVFVTGEAFPVELKRRLVELLPQVMLHSFFAMTEVGMIADLHHTEQLTHSASVGRVTPGVQVKLVDSAGVEVYGDAVGEILVNAGEPGFFNTMRCYFGRSEATSSTIVGGWFHTGDMGRFDEQGFLYLVDRKKDMVLSGGFNIYTKEVEQALAEHVDVAEAAVVGVPDDTFGEAVVAFIERRVGRTPSVEDIQTHSKSRIASYKKPRYVFFVEALPRNGVGKVLKAELREMALVRLGKRA